MRNVLRLLLPLVVACSHSTPVKSAPSRELAPVQQQGAIPAPPPNIGEVAASDLGAVGTPLPRAAEAHAAVLRPVPRRSAGADYVRDLTAIGDFVRARSAQLDFCYREALLVNPTLAVAFTVSTAITSDGEVTEVKVLKRSFTGAGTELLEGCVRTKISSWKFPQSDAPASVYPISLSFTR